MSSRKRMMSASVCVIWSDAIGYKTLADALAYARGHAAEVASCLPGREPDSFRLIDLSGATSAVF